MIRYPTYCSDYQNIQKADKYQIQALKTYQSNFFSSLIKNSKDIENLSQTIIQYKEELDNYYYLI